MDKRYRIELNERQLKIIYAALEEWFRIPLGQWTDVANRLAFPSAAPVSADEFKGRSSTRDHTLTVLKAAGEIARGRNLYREDDEIIASDMWRILREYTWSTQHYRDTYQQSDEPPIKVEAID